MVLNSVYAGNTQVLDTGTLAGNIVSHKLTDQTSCSRLDVHIQRLQASQQYIRQSHGAGGGCLRGRSTMCYAMGLRLGLQSCQVA